MGDVGAADGVHPCEGRKEGQPLSRRAWVTWVTTTRRMGQGRLWDWMGEGVGGGRLISPDGPREWQPPPPKKYHALLVFG